MKVLDRRFSTIWSLKWLTFVLRPGKLRRPWSRRRSQHSAFTTEVGREWALVALSFVSFLSVFKCNVAYFNFDNLNDILFTYVFIFYNMTPVRLTFVVYLLPTFVLMYYNMTPVRLSCIFPFLSLTCYETTILTFRAIFAWCGQPQRERSSSSQAYFDPLRESISVHPYVDAFEYL